MRKHIKGSWFEFQHHSKEEGVYWNPACARFTCADWDAKVKEMSTFSAFKIKKTEGVSFIIETG